jgi:hypothetical protein
MINTEGTVTKDFDLMMLEHRLGELRGNPRRVLDASVVIPVNAQADLRTVLNVLEDISLYSGSNTLEIVLVINNYPESHPPEQIKDFRQLGVIVIAVPSARRPGEVVIVSARALGVQSANSNLTIHFDADCKIPDIDALIDWYVEMSRSGVQLAYSHVGYYELRKIPSVYVKVALHHILRGIKRILLGIPTTRGSNYGIERSLFLRLYKSGKLSVDLQLGPAAKLEGARIVYSGDPQLRVFTSGRRFQGGWLKMLRYFRYRLRYNFSVIPSRKQHGAESSWDGFDRENEHRSKFSLPE